MFNKGIRAIFIGKDDSMDFCNGKEYRLRSDIKKVPGIRGKCICLYNLNGLGWCPYKNLEALLQNWKIIN